MPPSPVTAAQELAFLVTHAELLVMLSLQRLEASLDTGATEPAPSAQQLADAEAATLAELARQQQRWLEQPDAEPMEPAAALPMLAAPVATAAVDFLPEVEAALARAYAAVPARTQVLQEADGVRFMPALAALPAALPPLTQPMDAAGLSGWLDLHDAGDPALDSIVADAIGQLGEPG